MINLSLFKESIRRWYEGKYIPPADAPIKNDFLVFLDLGHHERHWTAKIAAAIVSFYGRHWQWFWRTLIAAAGLMVTLIAIK